MAKGVMSTEPQLHHALYTAWHIVPTQWCQFLFESIIWALSARSSLFLVFFKMSYKTSSGWDLLGIQFVNRGRKQSIVRHGDLKITLRNLAFLISPKSHVGLFIYLIKKNFWPHPTACGILVPQLRPLHWKPGVLTTGPPGKSLPCVFKSLILIEVVNTVGGRG